jgi:hypothetical protein
MNVLEQYDNYESPVLKHMNYIPKFESYVTRISVMDTEIMVMYFDIPAKFFALSEFEAIIQSVYEERKK